MALSRLSGINKATHITFDQNVILYLDVQVLTRTSYITWLKCYVFKAFRGYLNNSDRSWPICSASLKSLRQRNKSENYLSKEMIYYDLYKI